MGWVQLKGHSGRSYGLDFSGSAATQHPRFCRDLPLKVVSYDHLSVDPVRGGGFPPDRCVFGALMLTPGLNVVVSVCVFPRIPVRECDRDPVPLRRRWGTGSRSRSRTGKGERRLRLRRGEMTWSTA